MEELLTGLLPVAVAFATRYVYEGVQEVIKVFDKLPVVGKQAGAVVVAFLLTKAAVLVGVPLPAEMSGITLEVISSVLSALGAMGLHKLHKK